MKSLSLAQVEIPQGFWAEYQALIREVVIPFQYDALQDKLPGVEPSGAIENFKIAAGLSQGEFYGMVFQDSDVAKWLEAVAYQLQTHPDKALEQRADKVIQLVGKAQQPDGYLNTFYIINGLEDRFTNLLDCHELYCLGHFIEAAVAYYEATGKKELLAIVCRFTDLVDSLFGPEEGKTKGYPGHQEIELALVRLYQATGEKRYLTLATYFIDERGKDPSFFHQEYLARDKKRHWGGTYAPDLAYCQAHKPVREQTKAVGHAVRALYLYAAMADLAREQRDESLKQACDTLWKDIVHTQMYITGGVGQTHMGEAFTFSYDLPNDTIYSETCAAIALIFFAQRLLLMEAKGEYGDTIERALYNTVLAGMALDGKHFFYVNPLEVWPEASHKAPIRHHVKPQRPNWYPCSCCPPNVARLLGSLGGYAYGQKKDTVFVHQYLTSVAQVSLPTAKVTLTQTTHYPWEGSIALTVAPEKEGEFTVAVRIPAWCKTPKISLEGKALAVEDAVDGYLYITRLWGEESQLLLDFPMVPEFVYSNPQVRANGGKVALVRGPLVYCLEEADNQPILSSITVDTDAPLTEEKSHLFSVPVVEIHGHGYREVAKEKSLYSTTKPTQEKIDLTFIPHFTWANRDEGEMYVWLRKH